MRLDIRATNLWLTPPLLDHVERRVNRALGRHRAHIRRVTIRVVDVNGDRGGVDKQCRMVVHTASGGLVVVVVGDSDIYVAVTRAAAGASERLRRRSERRQTRRPPGGPGKMVAISDRSKASER